MLKSIHTAYMKLVLSGVIIVILFIALPFSWFSKNRTNHFRIWAKHFLRAGFFLTGIRITVTGREHLPDGPVIIASNHRSLLDTLAFLVFMDRPFFVITEPLSAMPNFFIQRWTENLGYIPIIRDKEDQIRHKVGMSRHYVVPLCVERLRKGESLVIYPEAHHERRNGLLAFKTGAVRSALEARVPLIPVALTGTEKVVTPAHFKIHPGHVHIRIGKPIDIERHQGKHKDRRIVRTLTKDLKNAIASLIPYDHR